MGDSRRFNVITSKGRVIAPVEARPDPAGLEEFLRRSLGPWPGAKRPSAPDPRETPAADSVSGD